MFKYWVFQRFMYISPEQLQDNVDIIFILPSTNPGCVFFN